MSAIPLKEQEINENYKAFIRLLPSIISEHYGEFAVMRSKEIVAYFDTAQEAMRYAASTYSDNIFSIQEVTGDAVDLGWFSHAPLRETIRP
jgi:hypothetical protein